MNDIEADSYQWDTPRHSKAPDLKPYAELVKALAEKAQQIARLENGLGCSRSHPHEDMNQICELRTEVARLNNELSQRTNLEGSAPCWNSAHMKYIATLREALMGILEIGKRDMTNPKYDGYFEQAKQALEDTKQ